MKLDGEILVSVVQVMRICQQKSTGIVLVYATMDRWCNGWRQTQHFEDFKEQLSQRNQDSHAVGGQSGILALEGTESNRRLDL